MDEKKVAVVGGGIAGLTAAWTLAKRGFKVTLFEERVHLGGKLGAHPGRIPLRVADDAGLRKALDLVRSVGASSVDPFDDDPNANIDLATGVFRLGRDEALRDRLESKVVPFWILLMLATHFVDVARRLRIEVDFKDVISALDYAFLQDLTIKQERGHGAEYRWLVQHPSLPLPPGGQKIKANFYIAIYRREDGEKVLELTDGVYHEHCYHMFLNWYHNFWDLMRDLNIDRCTAFTKHEDLTHLFPGRGPIGRRTSVLSNSGGTTYLGENLLSGAAPPEEMLLWLYSMVDLVSHVFDPARYLDRRSVHAFLASRWYATDESVRFHENVLAKAFAVPTYFSSAYTYRKYVEYTMAAPDPMLWVLNRDSYHGLFKQFEASLTDEKAQAPFKKVEILRGTRVVGISWGNDGIRLKYRPSDMRGKPRDPDNGARADDPYGDGTYEHERRERLTILKPDYVVLAVPPSALAHISGDFRDAVPGLDTVRKLKSGVTAVLDLHFNRKIPGIPAHHVILRDSSLGLTFIDNAQVWQAAGDDVPTQLNVAVTDFYKIEGMDKVEATAAVLADLRRFIEFDEEDIDYTRTYLQMNSGDPLFVNEVGSEPWRPGNVTDMPKLFLAGDFCDNDIGIVTVESAVVSGLLAVRALQAHLRMHNGKSKVDEQLLEPVHVRSPECEPLVNAEVVKALLLPQVAAAYGASKRAELSRHPERAPNLRDWQFHMEQALHSLGAVPAAAAGLGATAAQWLGEIHSRRLP